jgi:capsular exopolysaccharide synthesis family protein
VKTALMLRPGATELRKAPPLTRPARNGGIEPRALQALEAEQYRALSYMVEQFATANRTVIAVSSPVAGDGKTTTSINLARTLAQAPESRVLLVDADLRRGSVGAQLGIGRSTSIGLAGAIADAGCRLETVVRRRSGLNLSVLLAGTCPPLPYEALRSPRVGELLAEARQDYDYVIVDTSPVVPVADVRALSQWIDGFILVVMAHQTPSELLDEALSAMDPQKVVGIVFNGDDMLQSRRYGSYYSYAEAAPAPGFWASVLGSAARRRGR